MILWEENLYVGGKWETMNFLGVALTFLRSADNNITVTCNILCTSIIYGNITDYRGVTLFVPTVKISQRSTRIFYMVNGQVKRNFKSECQIV